MKWSVSLGISGFSEFPKIAQTRKKLVKMRSKQEIYFLLNVTFCHFFKFSLNIKKYLIFYRLSEFVLFFNLTLAICINNVILYSINQLNNIKRC